MINILNSIITKLKIYFRHRPHMGWSIVSFIFLFSMLFVVRWSESSDSMDFNIDETMEMVELRLSGPAQFQDIQESTDSTESLIEEKIEDKPLTFGSDSDEFNDLENSALPPRALFSKTPKYPDSMRKAGVEGVVVIELGINETGEVLYGKIIKSLGKEFDIVVIEWAKKIKFYPAKTKERIPMKCRINLPIRFKLEG
jgi:TonB family protein